MRIIWRTSHAHSRIWMGTSARFVVVIAAVLSMLAAFPASQTFAATTCTNYVPTCPTDAGTVSFPSTTNQVVLGYGAANADTTTFSLSSTTAVNIFVGDGFITGDQYTVSVDGNLLFTTNYISAADSGISTSAYGCSQSEDIADGLSWGDATITLGPGTHTIVVADVSTTLNAYPAGYCLVLAPPPIGTPQFPLGLPVILAVGIVGLLLIRRSSLLRIQRTA